MSNRGGSPETGSGRENARRLAVLAVTSGPGFPRDTQDALGIIGATRTARLRKQALGGLPHPRQGRQRRSTQTGSAVHGRQGGGCVGSEKKRPGPGLQSAGNARPGWSWTGLGGTTSLEATTGQEAVPGAGLVKTNLPKRMGVAMLQGVDMPVTFRKPTCSKPWQPLPWPWGLGRRLSCCEGWHAGGGRYMCVVCR